MANRTTVSNWQSINQGGQRMIWWNSQSNEGQKYSYLEGLMQGERDALINAFAPGASFRAWALGDLVLLRL